MHLSACIFQMQALRKHPVGATGTFRALVEPVTLKEGPSAGARMSAGTRVVVPPFGVHRNAKHWPDPERFDPGRFAPEAAGGRHVHAFQAFSSGPRDCIGRGLARAEALSLLAPLFRRFEFELVDGASGRAFPKGSAAPPEPRDHHMITRKPAEGVWFKLSRRE